MKIMSDNPVKIALTGNGIENNIDHHVERIILNPSEYIFSGER
jgi:hypothetical protein